VQDYFFDFCGFVDVPANAYFNTLLGSDADWSYRTVNQPHAGGGTLTWPRGKVLGGSSAINGMYLVRPSKIELDIWSSMISSQDNVSAAAWNWDNMYAAMKKTETFTPPSDKIKTTGNIQFNPDNHGTSGPLHYSYPGL
jgi:choline dehydrogenase-like flavoprotein